MRTQLTFAGNEYITVRTRTGDEVHLAMAGSSRTRCGHWLKVNAARMYVDRPATCETCKRLHPQSK